MYAKFDDNGNIQYAPLQIKKEGRIYFNPFFQLLREMGYKKIIETAMPEFKTGYHYIFQYIDKGENIEKVYSLEKDKEDLNDLETRITRLEKSQEQQNETIDTLLFAET